MVFGDNLPNHTLARPFNMVGKTLHMISSRTPWRCMVILNVAMWSQRSRIPSYESKVGISNLEGRGWLVIDATKGESILWTRSSIWFALLVESFISFMALFIWSISLSLQVGYSTSNSTSRMISSLSIIFSSFILWILLVLLTMVLSTMSVNFSS